MRGSRGDRPDELLDVWRRQGYALARPRVCAPSMYVWMMVMEKESR